MWTLATLVSPRYHLCHSSGNLALEVCNCALLNSVLSVMPTNQFFALLWLAAFSEISLLHAHQVCFPFTIASDCCFVQASHLHSVWGLYSALAVPPNSCQNLVILVESRGIRWNESWQEGLLFFSFQCLIIPVEFGHSRIVTGMFCGICRNGMQWNPVVCLFSICLLIMHDMSQPSPPPLWHTCQCQCPQQQQHLHGRTQQQWWHKHKHKHEKPQAHKQMTTTAHAHYPHTVTNTHKSHL